ncbi:tyrosine--tRNA ligase [Endozoicomonas sp. SM1973]|uniref:Tyrosine--tRNA ligase n=1 Tax=Spartinivicinus marinus TaxID=2994442 RepID=A0A853I996_9GAMM|nr:tyrosine--tRNA ligase [Spartinivicinus marinus]MCX4028052.1 tyrosine--tRNA ligase [Spartinivicinus marinus]NYZ68322.1 tyrosine--tRNA ligase [Spartinivicinus marinus]
MADGQNALINDLERRQLVAQMTAAEELADHMNEKPRVIYCGFDPTADSLHIGSLVPLLALKRFQQAGHKPFALVGGATGLIGDPSFKAAERKLNTPDVVAGWTDKIKQQVSQFIDFDCGWNSAEVVNNLDWTQNLDVLTFLRDIGKHFSVNAMIAKESVKQRIDRDGSGISYTEFTYMILQSYDFAELYKRHNCTIQIGGSDQWGNITGGIDLARRMHQAQTYGLTLPLVTKADGTKFGKTEAGTIWLDPTKTSQYAFYQFWINTADADVYRFLRYFTFLSEAEIQTIEDEDAKAEGAKSAQRILAQEVTKLVHGEEGVVAAKRISDALFAGDISNLSESDLSQLALDGMPATVINDDSKPLTELLVDTGLALTPRGQVTVGQARKFIKENAISVNGLKVADQEAVISKASGMYGKYHLLKRGKKVFHLVCWQ